VRAYIAVIIYLKGIFCENGFMGGQCNSEKA
jgi:hypothetical protein